MPTDTRTIQYHVTDASIQLRAEADLPPGIAGRVSGVALTYGTVDTYATMFARGCANRSINSRVAAGKLPLLMDHERSTGAHVGVVRSLTEVGDALVMVADVFDTADGRAALEYVKAVLASGASTGFSIGFVPRASDFVKVGEQSVERYTEIELREVSVTPMPAVQGADVTGARADTPARPDAELLVTAARIALDALSPAARAAVLAPYRDGLSSDAPAPASSQDTQGKPSENARTIATMDQRIAAVRQSLRH